MLKVYLGENYIFKKGVISNVSDYFDGVYEEYWFKTDRAREILMSIDNAEHIEGEYVRSIDGSAITPQLLSTGCKALLLLLNMPDVIISGDRMGDNCYKILLDMANTKDYTVTIGHYIDFSKFGKFEMFDIPTKKLITSQLEFIRCYILGSNDSGAINSTGSKTSMLEVITNMSV